MKANRAIEPGRIDRTAMMLGRRWLLILAAFFLLTPSGLLTAGLNSGAAFLKIGTGARPAALGGAYTALAGDMNALYYNPGGLAGLMQKELGLTHAEWLLGSKFDFAGFAQPTPFGVFGVGITRLGMGSQEGRSAERGASGGFSAADTAYALGFGRRFGAFGLGTSVKLLRSEIDGYSAQTVAFDLGANEKKGLSPLLK